MVGFVGGFCSGFFGSNGSLSGGGVCLLGGGVVFIGVVVSLWWWICGYAVTMK